MYLGAELEYEEPTFDNTQYIYEKLQQDENFSIDINMIIDELNKYADDLYNLYPYFFSNGVKAPWTLSYIRVGSRARKLLFELHDDNFSYHIKATKVEIDKLVEKANKFPNKFDQIYYINNKIDNMCIYDKSADYAYEAYGCLVDRKAVCTGYALAFKWCMDELGIKNRLKEDKKANHIWNQVYIEYNNELRWWDVDATWNDKAILSDYLLIKDHKLPQKEKYNKKIKLKETFLRYCRFYIHFY